MLHWDGNNRLAPRAVSYSAQSVHAAIQAERALQTRRRVVLALAAFVVVAIAIALMVPAISMTSETLPAAEQVALQAQMDAANYDAKAGGESEEDSKDVAEDQAAQTADSQAGSQEGEVESITEASGESNRAEEPEETSVENASEAQAQAVAPESRESIAKESTADDSQMLEEAAEDPMPAQDFYGEVRNKKGDIQLTVQVEAPEGALPEGATMKVTGVKSTEIQDAVDDALSSQNVTGEIQAIQAVDITFKDAQGQEIEPMLDVAVTFTAQGIAEAQRQPVVVHIDDQGESTVLDSLNKQQVEARDMNLDDDQLTFEAQDFSVYVLVYMVDFEYTPTDEENADEGGTKAETKEDEIAGANESRNDDSSNSNEPAQEPGTSLESYKYSLQGDGSMMLSDLFANLAISHSMAEVKDVSFTNSELLAVSQVMATGDETDWRLKSLQPFDTTESLDVALKDGSLIHIKVTDAQQYVAGKGNGKISVSKEMVYAAGMNKLSSGKIQLALAKDGEFVRSRYDSSKPYVLEMNIQGDGIQPSTVTFEGLEDGDYDVWEVHGDVNNGTINRSYDGMLLQNDTVELESIRVVANSNGQQLSSGRYNNNATIKNGSTASMTFRNTYRPATDKTSFEANKAWMDRKENFIQAPEDATVAFTLFKEVNGQTTSTGRTIVLDGVADGQGEKNPWQAVFADLPKTENGQQVKYKVKETTGWPDYYACKNKGKNLMGNEYLDSSGGTIYNRHLLATIQIQKHFDIQPNKYSDADWAEVIAKKQLSFELTNQDTNETWYFTLDESFTRDGQLFYYNVENMQAGHYILKEYRYRGLITDRKWDRGVTEYERYINPGDNMDRPLFEMEVQNWYVEGQDKPEGAYVKALKVWDDLDNFDGIRPDKVTVQLSATVDGNPYPDAIAKVANPIELSAANGWNTGNAWYNLPELDPNCKKIDYAVEEVGVPEGYTCTTAISENGTDKSYTFTNTHRPQGNGKVKIKKVVDAPAGANVPSTYYFTIQDADGKYWTDNGASTSVGYYTAVPVQANGTTGEVELELPVGKYTISEVRDSAEIPGYDLTVSGEGTFEVHTNQNQDVVVTNKYEERIPDGGLRVVKKWVDESGKSIDGGNSSATVQLRRYHCVSEGGGIASEKTVTVTFDYAEIERWGSNGKYYEKPEAKVFTARVTGSTATIKWAANGAHVSMDPSRNNPIPTSNGDTYSFTIDLSKTCDVTYYIVENWASGNPNSCTITGDGSKTSSKRVLEIDASFPSGAQEGLATTTLTDSNSWSHVWTIGDGNGFDFPASNENGDYLYYLVELDEQGNAVASGGKVSNGVELKDISYDSELIESVGVQSGLITVTNTKEGPKTGSVQVAKTFEGIDATQIPNDFTISATWEADGTQERTLSMSDDQQDGVTLAKDGMTYTWTIEGIPLGTPVTFAENNYEVEGYSVATQPEANANGQVVAQATADSTPGTAQFVNTYTKHEEPTLDVVIKKQGDKGEALSGAVFELYRHNGNVYEKLTSGDYGWLGPDDSFTVPGEGFTLRELKDGVYRLKELVAPAGYVIQEDTPVAFTVQDGKILQNANDLRAGAKYVPAAGSVPDTYIVLNTPGRELPSTGGPGLLPFYALAVLLLALAASFAFLSRKTRPSR